jgi:hypothetical protein
MTNDEQQRFVNWSKLQVSGGSLMNAHIPTSNRGEMTDEQHAEFARVLDLMTSTYMKKNAAYGSNAIASTGGYGIIVRMSDKVQRLITLSGKTLHDGNAHEYAESYEDTLLDLAVYAVIGIIYERGKWGK